MHRPPAEQMQMDVKNRLAGVAVGVEDRPKSAGRDAAGLRDQRGASHHLADELVVVGGEIVERRDVPPRHDEDVGRRLRIDVVEGDDALVFEDDGGVDFVIHDRAEEARRHNGIWCCVLGDW